MLVFDVCSCDCERGREVGVSDLHGCNCDRLYDGRILQMGVRVFV